jgi:Ion channel
MSESTTLRAKTRNREGRRSIVLLVSIVLLFTLAPMLENTRTGGVLLLLNLYITLVAATLELAGTRLLFWSTIPIAGASIILSWSSHYYPVRSLLIANYSILGIFLSIVTISLFAYLGKEGNITKDRLYVSVSLYFLIGLTWFALYSLINAIRPGSFTEAGIVLTDNIHWSKMLYFSLTTLTTLGYGDIVPVKPTARMIATLEAVAGVLYIAITVARLVAARTSEHDLDQ